MAIATLTIDINAKLANIERDLGKVSHLAEQSGKRITSAFSTAKAAFAGLGAGLSMAAFVTSLKDVVNGADQLQKASQKYGIAVEQLSALKYAGDLSDVSLEAIGNGLKKLSVNMHDTAAGTGEAKDAFKALGISVKDAGGDLKSSDAVLGEIADRFAGMEDGAGKTALAVKLFGRAGAELIPLLNQGSRGLKEMKEEAERLGAIVGGDLARASEQFNDNLTRIGASTDALKLSLAGGVIGGLKDFTDAMVEGNKIGGSFTEMLRLFVFNLDAMTSEKPAEEIRRLTKALEDYQRAGSLGKFMQSPSGFLFGGREEDLNKQIEFLKFLQRQEALAITAGSRGRLDSKDLGPTVPAKAPDSAGDKKKAADPFEALKKTIEAQHELAEAAANADAEIEKLRNHYIDMIEPATQTMREMRTFEEIAPALGLSAEQLERIRDVFRDKISVEEYGNPLKDISAEIKKQDDLAKGLGLTFQSAFEDAVIAGKKFSDVLKGLADDIARMILRKTVTEPLGNAFSGLLSGLLSNVFMFHDGGVVGAGGTPMLAPVSLFAGAKRYHSGGFIGPNEVPAILEKGEFVIPKGDAFGGVTINVIEAPGVKAQVERRNSPDGRSIIDIVLEQTAGYVANNIARGGVVADALQGTYGLNRAAGAWR